MSLRTRKDAALTVTKALPAAGAATNTPSIDLGANPAAVLEGMEMELSIQALPNNVDADHGITAKLQDSEDGVTFADIAMLPSVSLAGTPVSGSIVMTKAFKMPSHTRRYVQANLAASAGAGDNTAKSATLTPLF
jgi:hypothetical protein